MRNDPQREVRAIARRKMSGHRSTPDAVPHSGNAVPVADTRSGAVAASRSTEERLERTAQKVVQAIALYGRVPAYFCELGRIRKAQGRMDDAAEQYHQALHVDPDCTDALIDLGILLTECGRLDEACATLERAIVQRPASLEGHIHLGKVRLSRYRFELAAESFRRALSIDATALVAWIGLGSALDRLGDPGSAQACFQRATALHADGADAVMQARVSTVSFALSSNGRRAR